MSQLSVLATNKWIAITSKVDKRSDWKTTWCDQLKPSHILTANVKIRTHSHSLTRAYQTILYMYWQYSINNSSSSDNNLWRRKKSPFEHIFKMYFECAGFCWLFSRALIISNGTHPIDDGAERQEFNIHTLSHTFKLRCNKTNGL